MAHSCQKRSLLQQTLGDEHPWLWRSTCATRSAPNTKPRRASKLRIARVFSGVLYLLFLGPNPSAVAEFISAWQADPTRSCRWTQVQITSLPDEWGQRAWAGHLCANKQKARWGR